MPTEKDHFREFFHGLNIKETWNKAETDAEVTYSDHESAFKITGLHYHSEDLWDSKLDRVVHRSRVLDWRKHKSWPEGYNNTDEIIQDMVSRCDGQKEACLSFLRQLREHVHAALVHGMPGRYWPNILNNNHWQDVANLIKLCVEDPDEAAHLIDQVRQGKDVYPLNRLVFRWLPDADRDRGIYKGVYRCAFHGKYRMIESLLASASPDKSRAFRKYGSSGEGKNHRELKEHLAKHPEELGLKEITHHKVEHGFMSRDSADLVFWHKNGEITVVEIETDFPRPGDYQLIKYRALLCAENGLRLDSHTVHAILVAWSIPPEIREFCRKYGISCQEHKLPK